MDVPARPSPCWPIIVPLRGLFSPFLGFSVRPLDKFSGQKIVSIIQIRERRNKSECALANCKYYNGAFNTIVRCHTVWPNGTHLGHAHDFLRFICLKHFRWSLAPEWRLAGAVHCLHEGFTPTQVFLHALCMHIASKLQRW